jgi:hypothetical protein
MVTLDSIYRPPASMLSKAAAHQPRGSWDPVSRIMLIVVFGALPATILGLYAVMLLMVGLRGVVAGSAEAWAIVTWGGAGVWGSVALWLAAFRTPGKWLAAGLVGGCVAAVPLVLMVALQFGGIADGMWLVSLSVLAFICSPVLTALLILGAAWRQRPASGPA